MEGSERGTCVGLEEIEKETREMRSWYSSLRLATTFYNALLALSHNSCFLIFFPSNYISFCLRPEGVHRVGAGPVTVPHVGSRAGGAGGPAVDAGVEPFGSTGGAATGMVVRPDIVVSLRQQHWVEAESLELDRGLHEGEVLKDICLAKSALVGDSRWQRGRVEDTGLAESTERAGGRGGFGDWARSGTVAV